jgi:hypothetical protein
MRPKPEPGVQGSRDELPGRVEWRPFGSDPALHYAEDMIEALVDDGMMCADWTQRGSVMSSTLDDLRIPSSNAYSVNAEPRDEALAQQAATTEVLQVNNASGGDVAPVSDAMPKTQRVSVRPLSAFCGCMMTSGLGQQRCTGRPPFGR